MNRNLWAPAGAVAATLAVVAAASLLTTDRRPAAPPVLRIAGAGSADATSVAAPGSGSYQLVGTLPGGPSEATVRDLPATLAPVARVRALASALGEDAAPVRLDNAWMAGDLKVADEPGNPWSWGQACDPETAVASDGTSYPSASGCTFAGASTGVVAPVEPTGGGLPGVDLPGAVDLPLPVPPPQAQLDEATALDATATLRDVLDLDDAASRIEGTTLVLEPIAGDLPTSGAATVVRLSEKGRLVSATGWLSTGTQGARYPLRSAREALDDLPVLALGAPCDAAGCPERAAGPVVTGARLGLSRVALAGPAAALVPSWLFDVEGSAVPLVALAVADRFLGEPDPAGIDPGTRPGAPEPGGVEPGGVGSDPGKPIGPDAGPPSPPEDREMFGFDGAYADPDPLVLVVRYGDSGSCPSQAVQHSVVEEPDRVIVHLSRTPAPTMQACTADYRAVLVRVVLQAPLAGREVMDGSRKEPVPVSTGSPPFG